MRRSTLLILALFAAVIVLPSVAMAGNGNFYNWLRDDDGDGIPNCLDPDWFAPEDGSGYQNSNGKVVEVMTDADDNGNGDCTRLKLQDGTGDTCPDTCLVP